MSTITDHETKEKKDVLSKQKNQHPSMYRVILHNDDYTTMEFVVEILMTIFGKSLEKAYEIMLNVHKNGIGICGIYTFEIAETKVNAVHKLAGDRGFPLRSTMEKE